MELLLFKTLWGHHGTPSSGGDLAVTAGFDGIEAPAVGPHGHLAELEYTLDANGLEWIQEICTAGSYVPERHATVREHLKDLEAQIRLGAAIQPRFINVMGGCDAWRISQSVAFFKDALELGEKYGVQLSFETHRGRSMYCPWNTVDILEQVPEMRITCDFSHWVVVAERLMDSEWDAITLAAEHAHHIHSRVGYDQGPQVPHPGAPEYAECLASHQRCWEAIWQAQVRRGYSQTTMTPEFGPDGYLHHLPFTNAPIADLWDLNRWIGATEKEHFAQVMNS